MQIFRSKRLLLVTAILLWIGVSSRFYVAQTDSGHSTELTNWLLTFADKEQSELASTKLKSVLQQDPGGFHGMLTKASEIIVEHPNLFNLPVDSNSSSNQDVLEVLLTQWNLHNQTSGMSNGVQTERNRASVTTTNETYSIKYWAQKVQDTGKSATTFLSSHIPLIEVISKFVIRPMIDGLSINAP
jgi:hypothetical protein